VPGSYYGGADLWGNSFTNDVGDLFEQNVGAAARDDPNTQLYPQILYDEVKRSSTGSSSPTTVLVEVKLAGELFGVPGAVGLDRVGHENRGLTWGEC